MDKFLDWLARCCIILVYVMGLAMIGLAWVVFWPAGLCWTVIVLGVWAQVRLSK